MGRKLTTGIVGGQGDLTLQAQSDLRLADADSSNYVAIQAPAVVPANYTLTLPSAVAATTGFALVSDTSGVLSWATAGAAIATPSNNASYFPTFSDATTGNFFTANVNSNLTFNPSTQLLSVPNLTISGTTTINEVTEVTTSIGSYGTSQSRAFTDGNVFHLNGLTGNYTFNWTGVPTTTLRAITLTHIIDQGGTPRIPTTLQINSSSVTINWAGNVAPTGSASRRNIISFFITNEAGTFVCSAVLGSY
jgi:hypothetical protein